MKDLFTYSTAFLICLTVWFMPACGDLAVAAGNAYRCAFGGGRRVVAPDDAGNIVVDLDLDGETRVTIAPVTP